MNAAIRTSIIHRIKILPEFYELVTAGIKTAESRRADRDYRPGDILEINEWSDGKFTGRRAELLISHVLSDPEYVKEGFVILSFQMIFPDTEPRMSISTWERLYENYLKVIQAYEKLQEEVKER
jgi:hypothetical protein